MQTSANKGYFMQARYRHFECLAHCLAWLVKGVAHIGNKISTSLRKIGVSYRGAQNGAQNIVKKDPGRARQISLAKAGTF